MPRLPILLGLFVTLNAPLAAQHDHGKAPASGIGRVRFPTTCSPAAQPSLERAVALLHNFWYEEAAAAFREAGSRDSSCAMAWWGVGMTYLRPLWPPLPLDTLRLGEAASTRAVTATTADSRERAYVAALAAFYRDLGAVAPGARLAAWKGGMERLYQQAPGDREGTIFYALSLIATAPRTDPTYAQYRRAAQLLEPLFRETPDHPGLAHYLIHAYDAPGLAATGLDAANKYAGIAPAVPHARHMPSHVYVLVGKWTEAIESNRRSAEAARQFEREQRLGASWDQTLHALDYLVYAYLQQGRGDEATRVAQEAGPEVLVYPEGSLIGEYAVAAIPARMAMERGRWAEAARLPLRPGPAPAQAVTWFARAVGAARSGDTTRARVALAALEQTETASQSIGDPIWPVTIRAQRVAASAWQALATGDTANAVRLAREAADLEDGSVKHPVTPGAILPARELYGDLLLGSGRAAEARAAYETMLTNTPRRGRSFEGAALAAERMGDGTAAAKWRAELAALRREGSPGR